MYNAWVNYFLTNVEAIINHGKEAIKSLYFPTNFWLAFSFNGLSMSYNNFPMVYYCFPIGQNGKFFWHVYFIRYDISQRMFPEYMTDNMSCWVAKALRVKFLPKETTVVENHDYQANAQLPPCHGSCDLMATRIDDMTLLFNVCVY